MARAAGGGFKVGSRGGGVRQTILLLLLLILLLLLLLLLLLVLLRQLRRRPRCTLYARSIVRRLLRYAPPPTHYSDHFVADRCNTTRGVVIIRKTTERERDCAWLKKYNNKFINEPSVVRTTTTGFPACPNPNRSRRR